MIKSVIFDMDGVLVDTMPLHSQLEITILARHGIVISSADLMPFHGIPFAQVVEALSAQHKKPLNPADLCLEKEKLYPVTITTIEPIHGVVPLLSTLKQRRVMIAVGSSSPLSIVNATLTRAAISDYFDTIVTIENVRHGKPAPDIFLEAAKQLNVAPETCLVIEDAASGVTAAKRAGMLCYAFRNPNSGNQDLSAADLIFDRFEPTLLDHLFTDATR